MSVVEAASIVTSLFRCTMRAQDNSTWRFAAVVVLSVKFSPLTRRVGKTFPFHAQSRIENFPKREVLSRKKFSFEKLVEIAKLVKILGELLPSQFLPAETVLDKVYREDY